MTMTTTTAEVATDGDIAAAVGISAVVPAEAASVAAGALAASVAGAAEAVVLPAVGNAGNF